MRVFVHLPYGFDAAEWERKWRSGELLGLNERTPYGYHHATDLGCVVTFSHDSKERLPDWVARGGFRVLLGFDLVHAYRNREGLRAADVIWTHTESQHLAVLALFRLLGIRGPKIICQSVWLMDKWEKLNPLTKSLYRLLLSRADILTFHSPCNLKLAQEQFPGKRCELVRFGIRAEIQSRPRLMANAAPYKILSLGNDRHRDWPTLIKAIGGSEDFVLKIASQAIPPQLVQGQANVEIVNPKTNAELKGLYAWADVVVVPLTKNYHASGITVLQEAALFGVPAVCTRVGGLTAYFTDDEVVYVSPGNAEELRSALRDLCSQPERAMRMAERAQARMSEDDLSSKAYVSEHVQLSRELVGAQGNSDEASR